MKKTTALALFVLGAAAAAPAAVVFTESFEDPDVATYSNTPSITNWVNANQGFGANRHGIWDESHDPYSSTTPGPTGSSFTTPYGEQAWLGRYTNSGITTREGVIGEWRASTKYILNFNVADPSGDDATYTAILMGYNNVADADRNDVRGNPPGAEGVVVAVASGGITGNDFSQSVNFEFNTGPSEIYEGFDIGIVLLGATANPMYDNISFDDQGFRSALPEPGTAAFTVFGMLLLRALRREENPTFA